MVRHRPTRKQLTRLWALAHRAGLSHDAVHAEVQRRYGILSTRDLSPQQYQGYTSHLARRAARARQLCADAVNAAGTDRAARSALDAELDAELDSFAAALSGGDDAIATGDDDHA